MGVYRIVWLDGDIHEEWTEKKAYRWINGRLGLPTMVFKDSPNGIKDVLIAIKNKDEIKSVYYMGEEDDIGN